MNYNILYSKFIESRPIRVKRRNNDTEKHHIIPKSIGGTDSKDNLIVLTPREHFIAHRLLHKLSTGIAKSKMAYALVGMVHRNGMKLTSRSYEYIRIQTRKDVFEERSRISKALWQRPEYRAKFIKPGSSGSGYKADGTKKYPNPLLKHNGGPGVDIYNRTPEEQARVNKCVRLGIKHRHTI